MKKFIYIREWLYRKVESASSIYNCFINVEDETRNELGLITANENGYVKCLAEEIISESDKAIQVRLATGFIVGSSKGWTTWLPKSACIIEE